MPQSENLLSSIIVLSGGGGGISESRAAFFASKGFAVFALAYFNYEGLSPHLEDIPLEYFEKAFDWLQSHPKVNSRPPGLHGVSRGGELALLLGSLFPERISAIAAVVPSSAVYGTLSNPDVSAWTYQGKPVLPAAPIPKTVTWETGKSPDTAIALTPFFLAGMKDKEAFEAATIPVENIRCPLLLISGEDDQNWPSSLFCRQIIERLNEKGSSVSCTHLSYPGAGHFIQPAAPPSSKKFHPTLNLWLNYGGNAEDDLLAGMDSSDKTNQFFKQHLN